MKSRWIFKKLYKKCYSKIFSNNEGDLHIWANNSTYTNILEQQIKTQDQDKTSFRNIRFR